MFMSGVQKKILLNPFPKNLIKFEYILDSLFRLAIYFLAPPHILIFYFINVFMLLHLHKHICMKKGKSFLVMHFVF